MNKFAGKKICILGDSLTEHGFYCYDMRSFMHRNKDKAYIFNRGIGGNKTSMADCLLDDEIFSLKPDYCFICFGGNDLGSWLYRSDEEPSIKTIREREERNEAFRKGLWNIVYRCRINNVIPVILTPIAHDELVEEKEKIETVHDNLEKLKFLDTKIIGRNFYQRINAVLKNYADFEKDFGKEYNVEVFDIFSKTYEYMKTVEGLYREDGCHLTEKGHAHTAHAIIECMGYDNVPFEFVKDKENDEIFSAEQLERSTRFLPYNTFNRQNGFFDDEDVKKGAKETAENPQTEKWLVGYANNYLKYYGHFEELKQKVIELTLKY